MHQNPTASPQPHSSLQSLIEADAEELSKRLQAHQMRIFPPTAQKSIRSFTPAEAASFIGVAEGYLRQIVSEGHGPAPQSNGRRMYSIQDIHAIRQLLDDNSPKTHGKYIRHRRNGEKLQIISVMNFKGGSAKPPRQPTSPNIWRCVVIAFWQLISTPGLSVCDVRPSA